MAIHKRKTPTVRSASEEQNTGAEKGSSARAESKSIWSDADRKWFAAHPRRSHRVRKMFEGEFLEVGPTPAGHQVAVVVQQIMPGVRVRISVFLVAHLVPSSAPESIAAALFDILREGGAPGTVIPWREVHSRAHAHGEAAERRPS